ncbi:hypothetical protein UFOVP605_23 [uncultured Caudovirales phage]|uniref:Uncharacterized protein n=1 Tax=uncultured Caudovirales phage TaxID=2100421 RepID=A0A6J5NB15_9CAUD|nr:hypothetical protein UFOVP605_23 [uncultured Caudovirales phage]
MSDNYTGNSPNDAAIAASSNKTVVIEISPEISVLRLARALAMEGLCMAYRNGKICIVNRSRYLDGGTVRHGWVPDFLRHKGE